MDKQLFDATGRSNRHRSSDLRNSALADQRSLPRQRSVFRVARVSAGNETGFARVLNISDEGLMLSIALNIQSGSELQIDLSESVRLVGEVIWCDGANCGVHLYDPIDSAATLVRLFADSVRGGDRPLRLACSSEASVLGEFGQCMVQIEDISLRGLKVRHNGAFREGIRVKMVLGTLSPREAVVRWSSDERAGLAMIEPFSLQDLGSSIRPAGPGDEQVRADAGSFRR